MRTLVYQMGKVGSISLMKGLAAQGIIASHAHNIVNVNGEFYISWNKAIKNTVETRKDEWRVISLVRDPMARNISAFAHKLSKENYIDYPKYNPERLFQLFTGSYDHDTPLRWFDEEFNVLFGDVYSRKFRGKSRYLKIDSEEKKYKAIVLRTEDLDWYHNSLRSFLGVEKISIPRANSMQEKFWFYKEFVNFVKGRMPSTIINRIYTSKFVTHFYSEEEIAKFVKYWTLT